MVTEQMIEENLLATLSAKHELAMASLDMESEVDAVSMESGMDDLKRRLELLLGKQEDALVDESQHAEVHAELEIRLHKQNVARAGGELMTAAFSFLSEMVPISGETPQSNELADQFKAGLTECLERSESGEYHLKVSFKNTDALDALATSLARIASLGKV